MKSLFSLLLFNLIIVMMPFQDSVLAASDKGQLILVATMPINALPVEVSTTCTKGDAVFTVKNVGEKFPSAIDFTIIDVSTDTDFSKRRMNLAAGQSATFKLRNADKIPGDVGLFMDAKWFPRERQIDASVRCGK